MKKATSLLFAAMLAGVAVTTYAQAPAASGDPIVQMRQSDSAARKTYNEAVKKAKEERKAEMAPMIEKSVQEATAKGVDPLVAKRDAEKKAKAATKASYDAKVKAAKKDRDAAMAESHKKAGKSR